MTSTIRRIKPISRGPNWLNMVAASLRGAEAQRSGRTSYLPGAQVRASPRRLLAHQEPQVSEPSERQSVRRVVLPSGKTVEIVYFDEPTGSLGQAPESTPPS